MNVKKLRARKASSLPHKCGSSAFLSSVPGTSIQLIIQLEIWNSLLSTPFLLSVPSLSHFLTTTLNIWPPDKDTQESINYFSLIQQLYPLRHFGRWSSLTWQDISFPACSPFITVPSLSLPPSLLPPLFFPFGSRFSAPRRPTLCTISSSVYSISILHGLRRWGSSSWGHNGVLPRWRLFT